MKPDDLLREVRDWDPVPPGSVARARLRLRLRLGARRRRSWVPVIVLTVVALLLWVSRSSQTGPEADIVRGAAADRTAVGASETAGAQRGPTQDFGSSGRSRPVDVRTLRPSERSNPRVATDASGAGVASATRPSLAVSSARAPTIVTPPSTLRDETPAPAPTDGVAEAKAEPRKAYVPRAIAEFQNPDWDELAVVVPTNLKPIVRRKDPKALLAALDRMPVYAELQVVRGELRVNAARCADAVADFDAVLASGTSRLSTRALRGKDLCVPRH